MASRLQPDGAQHVGLVVDPLAREDGELEPQFEPAPPPPRESSPAPAEGSTAVDAEADALAPSPEPDARDRGLHPVKARLLARARAVDARLGPPVEVEAEYTANPGLDALRGDHEPPSLRAASAVLGSRRPQLSPNLVALFGALLGLAVVASLIALGISLDPRPWDPTGTEPPVAVQSPESEPAPSAVVAKPKRVKVPGPWRIADAKEDPSLRVIEGKIGLSPFLKAVQDAGLEKAQAYRALTALKDLKNLDRCDKNDTFVALVERSSKRLRAFEYVVSKEEIYQAREGTSGLLSGKKLDLKVERNQIKVAFAVAGGGIEADAQSAGLEPGLAAVLSKALEGHMSLEELKRGDRIRVVVQEVSVLGEFSRYAGVEALEVTTGASSQRIYYFRGPTSRGYFDAKGRSPYEGGWRKPIPTAPITSKFNPKRMHPVVKKVMPHNGTDFGAPTGTPIGASSFGTVSFIGYAGASGNLVQIEHPGGYETGYAHLSRFVEGMKVGDTVKRLQVIGYVGSTGRSTGPHLHFSVKKNGQFIDPESLNLDGMRVLPASERDAFANARQTYDALLDSVQLPVALAEASPAAAADPALDPSSGDDLDLPAEPTGGPAPAAATSLLPSPAAAPNPAPRSTAGSFYLTDQELLKLQGRSNDGEVD